jgi:hypothetical protein
VPRAVALDHPRTSARRRRVRPAAPDCRRASAAVAFAPVATLAHQLAIAPQRAIAAAAGLEDPFALAAAALGRQLAMAHVLRAAAQSAIEVYRCGISSSTAPRVERARTAAPRAATCARPATALGERGERRRVERAPPERDDSQSACRCLMLGTRSAGHVKMEGCSASGGGSPARRHLARASVGGRMIAMRSRCTMAAVAMLAVGCGAGAAATDSGDPGGASDGTPRDGHTAGDGSAAMDGALPSAISCTAGAAMCVGDQLGSCTLSGHDAVLLQDCRATGTATNPGRCATAGCAAGASACCARADEPCAYAISTPTVDNSGTSSCIPPTTTLNPSCGTLNFIALGTPTASPNVCSADSFEFAGTIDRSKHVAGATFSPVTTDSFLFVQSVLGVARSCFNWTGTVNWVSDVPAWRVEVDLTCSSDTSLHVVVAFHGTL